MVSVRFVVFYIALIGCIAADDPTVELKSGKVAGRVVEFAHKDVDVKCTVHVFQGIPYAEPPIGDLRFQAPISNRPWEGVRDAKELGKACIQPYISMFPLDEPQSEDCLYLNIYAPQRESGKLPVMVWIHGGALFMGSGGTYYDGTALAALGDVILVAINYRLGPFGFFSTGDEHATGNYGFLDQVLALQWVQDNIAAFGGDASKVTIFGESAGAISSEYLVLSPLTDGLFNRAILQSGTASLQGYISTDVAFQNKMSHGLGKLVGCERETSKELVECLRSVPAEDFVDASDPQTGQLANITGLGVALDSIPFPPVIDGKVVAASPMDLIRDGTFPKRGIDLMIGALADEGQGFLMMIFPDKANDTDVSLNRTIYDAMYPTMIGRDKKNNPAVVDAVKIMYVDWENADSEDADYVEALSQSLGDMFFVCPADLSARAHSEAGSNVYLYHMTHIPALSIVKIKWLKATHGEDLAFVFGWHFNSAMNWTMPEDDVKLSLKVIEYWTNFAKTGNPNLSDGDVKALDEEAQSEWPLFKVPGLEYKDLSLKMETKRALKAKECAFWNDFIPKLMKHTEAAQVCTTAEDDEKAKYKEENQKKP
ncbi:fatty acyl-CoA hydrolase precursor, medium chain-like [Ptychodera flava]|uniref:fatty acyl-CoA hydrolase precursor, medium chain-like n=1 Tax=Ptychodera flava TaxID=63121 RepID=UPI00396AA9B8